MYKLIFFVPVDDAECVKEAVFGVGAGQIGPYDQCAWQTLGEGQFRPLSGSTPTLGELGKLEVVSELRVEMVCERSCIKDAISALKASHPYETPAYEVIELIEI